MKEYFAINSGNQIRYFGDLIRVKILIKTSRKIALFGWVRSKQPEGNFRKPIFWDRSLFVWFQKTKTTKLMISKTFKLGFAALVLSVSSLLAQNSTLVNIAGGTLPSWSNFGGQSVAAFKIATTEVTKAEWDAVKAYADANNYDINNVSASGSSRPVERVDWYDALKWSNAKSRQAGLQAVYSVSVGVVSITRNNTTATVTTAANHNLVTGDNIVVSGASQSGYNISANATRTGARTFTYTVSNATVTPASGTIAVAVPYKVGDFEPIVTLANTGFRLPTEREWEWAGIGGASANSTFGWAGSNNATAVAWSKETTPTSTQNVGTKTANQLSLFDFSGNVYEWTYDDAAPLVGRRIRGGGWIVSADSCRILVRGYAAPTAITTGFGFRLAQKQ